MGGVGGGSQFFSTQESITTTSLTIKQSMHPLDIVWVNCTGEPVAKTDNLAIVMKSV